MRFCQLQNSNVVVWRWRKKKSELSTTNRPPYRNENEQNEKKGKNKAINEEFILLNKMKSNFQIQFAVMPVQSLLEFSLTEFSCPTATTSHRHRHRNSQSQLQSLETFQPISRMFSFGCSDSDSPHFSTQPLLLFLCDCTFVCRFLWLLFNSSAPITQLHPMAYCSVASLLVFLVFYFFYFISFLMPFHFIISSLKLTSIFMLPFSFVSSSCCFRIFFYRSVFVCMSSKLSFESLFASLHQWIVANCVFLEFETIWNWNEVFVCFSH